VIADGMYGYKAIFGAEIVDGTNMSVSDLIGSSLNSEHTLDEVEKLVTAYLVAAKFGAADEHYDIKMKKGNYILYNGARVTEHIPARLMAPRHLYV
jgi:hypothetical protein